MISPLGGDYFPSEIVLFLSLGTSVHDPFVVLHMPVALMSKYVFFAETNPVTKTVVPKERISFEFPAIFYSYAPNIQSLCNATSNECPSTDPITFLNCGFYAIDQSRINYIMPPESCNGAFPPATISYRGARTPRQAPAAPVESGFATQAKSA